MLKTPFLIIILILIAAAVAAVLTYQGKLEKETAQEQVAVPETPAQPQEADTMERASSDTTVQGIIRVVHVGGPNGQAVILSSEDGSVGITGPLLDEIYRLAGVEVRVWGTLVPNDLPPPLQAIEVSEYEVISWVGQKPYLGILTETDGILRLDGLILVGTSSLQRQVGAKVLILGRVSGDTLSVSSYRIIRKP